jgi:hypothetical protein
LLLSLGGFPPILLEIIDGFTLFSDGLEGTSFIMEDNMFQTVTKVIAALTDFIGPSR